MPEQIANEGVTRTTLAEVLDAINASADLRDRFTEEQKQSLYLLRDFSPQELEALKAPTGESVRDYYQSSIRNNAESRSVFRLKRLYMRRGELDRDNKRDVIIIDNDTIIYGVILAAAAITDGHCYLRAVDLSYPISEGGVVDEGVRGMPSGKVIDTPEFKAWFAGSKVVNKHGRPLVVYHGTQSKGFKKFKSDSGISFFSTSVKFASNYAQLSADKNGVHTKARVMPVYLKMTKPFDYRKDGERVARWFVEETGGISDSYAINRMLGADLMDSSSRQRFDQDDFIKLVKKGSWDAIECDEFIDWLRGSGYDGIILYENKAINYGVFDSKQIKSAIGNNKSFDPNSEHIDENTSVSAQPRQIGAQAASGLRGLTASVTRLKRYDYEIFDDVVPMADIKKGIYIADIIVEPRLRGHGLGTKFIQAIVKLADVHGIYIFAQSYPHELVSDLEVYDAEQKKRVKWHEQYGFKHAQNGWMWRAPKNYRAGVAFNPESEHIDENTSAPMHNPAFDKWFAGSKMVDRDGRPLIVYHGTNSSELKAFDRKRSRVAGLIFVTTDKDFASGYGNNIIPLYARAVKIFDASDPDEFHAWGETSEFQSKNVQARMRALAEELEGPWEEDHYEAYGIEPIDKSEIVTATDITDRIDANDGNWSNWYVVEIKEFIDYLKSNGYDAAKMKKHGKITYALFGGNAQVKRVSSTRFDPDSDRIDESATTSHQTETRAFTQWFGDSHVVDAEGKPLVVFHGQPSTVPFNSFDPMKGRSFGKFNRFGSWFTADSKQAKIFAQHFGDDKRLKDGNVYAAYLKIERPWILDGKRGWVDLVRVFTHRTGKKTYEADEQAIETFREYLRRSNKDGIIINNFDGDKLGADEFQTYYVVLNPNQIKSATSNNGAFDLDSENIDESASTSARSRQIGEQVSPGLHKLTTPQTGLPSFKRWFGGSKVVDKNGDPLRMYHGTNSPEDFKTFKQSGKFKDISGPKFGIGFYFSSHPRGAETFTRRSDSNRRIVPVYLSVQKPVMDEDIPDDIQRGYWPDWAGERGYDGIITKHDDTIWQVIVLRPSQIKSATGNIGTFDPESDRIDESASAPAQSASLQTQSPMFKRWFRNSKAIDENGDPLVVYHGTTSSFTSFDATKRSDKTGNPSAQLGFFFSDSPEESSRYASDWGKNGGRVMPVYLSISNPYKMSYREFDDLAMAAWNSLRSDPDHDPNATVKFGDVKGQRAAAERIQKHEKVAREKASIRRDELIAQGYDGIVVKVSGRREFIAFYPRQIKSAIGNIGTFDPGSNEIHERVYNDEARDASESADWDDMYPGSEKSTHVIGPAKINYISGRTWYHGRSIKAGEKVIFAANRPAFFTRDPEDAKWFSFERGEGEPSLISAKINIKKPARLRDLLTAVDNVGAKEDDISAHSPYDGTNDIDYIYVPAVRAELQRNGFDGFVGWDTLANSSIEIAVPFDPMDIDVTAQDVVKSRLEESSSEGGTFLWRFLNRTTKPLYSQAVQDFVDELGPYGKDLDHVKTMADLPKRFRNQFGNWLSDHFRYYGVRPSSLEHPAAFMKAVRQVKQSEWLIHFTNSDPMNIVRSGFTSGSGPRGLHLTRSKGEVKRLASTGLYAFGFVASDEDWFDRADSGQYGADAVLFRAGDAVEVEHLTDAENQVVFDRTTAKDMVAIRRGKNRNDDDWAILDPKTGETIHEDPLHLCIEWIEKHWPNLPNDIENIDESVQTESHGGLTESAETSDGKSIGYHCSDRPITKYDDLNAATYLTSEEYADEWADRLLDVLSDEGGQWSEEAQRLLDDETREDGGRFRRKWNEAAVTLLDKAGIRWIFVSDEPDRNYGSHCYEISFPRGTELVSLTDYNSDGASLYIYRHPAQPIFKKIEHVNESQNELLGMRGSKRMLFTKNNSVVENTITETRDDDLIRRIMRQAMPVIRAAQKRDSDGCDIWFAAEKPGIMSSDDAFFPPVIDGLAIRISMNFDRSYSKQPHPGAAEDSPAFMSKPLGMIFIGLSVSPEGKLIDISNYLKHALAHELEHYNEPQGALPIDNNETQPSSLHYILQPIELQSTIAGVYKQAKATKLPFSKVLKKHIDAVLKHDIDEQNFDNPAAARRFAKNAYTQLLALGKDRYPGAIVESITTIDNESTLFESVSYTYKVPGNNQDRVFDFYTLSLFDQLLEGEKFKTPDGRDVKLPLKGSLRPGWSDETVADLHAIVHDGLSDLLNVMKDDLLDATATAISSEIRHVADTEARLDIAYSAAGNMEPKLRKFIGYLEKQTKLSYSPKATKDKNNWVRVGTTNAYTAAKRAFDASGLSYDELASLGERMFSIKQIWDDGYGGEPWVNISSAMRKLSHAASKNDLIRVIDHVFDLQHNTNLMLDKVKRFADESGSFDWIKDALDFKFAATPWQLAKRSTLPENVVGRLIRLTGADDALDKIEVLNPKLMGQQGRLRTFLEGLDKAVHNGFSEPPLSINFPKLGDQNNRYLMGPLGTVTKIANGHLCLSLAKYAGLNIHEFKMDEANKFTSAAEDFFREKGIVIVDTGARQHGLFMTVSSATLRFTDTSKKALAEIVHSTVDSGVSTGVDISVYVRDIMVRSKVAKNRDEALDVFKSKTTQVTGDKTPFAEALRSTLSKVLSTDPKQLKPGVKTDFFVDLQGRFLQVENAHNPLPSILQKIGIHVGLPEKDRNIWYKYVNMRKFVFVRISNVISIFGSADVEKMTKQQRDMIADLYDVHLKKTPDTNGKVVINGGATIGHPDGGNWSVRTGDDLRDALQEWTKGNKRSDILRIAKELTGSMKIGNNPLATMMNKRACYLLNHDGAVLAINPRKSIASAVAEALGFNPKNVDANPTSNTAIFDYFDKHGIAVVQMGTYPEPKVSVRTQSLQQPTRAQRDSVRHAFRIFKSIEATGHESFQLILNGVNGPMFDTPIRLWALLGKK